MNYRRCKMKSTGESRTVEQLPQHLRTQILEISANLREIELVMLFGSRARGDADERSDIDLAVSAPRASQRQRLDILDALDDLDTLLAVDTVIWEEAPTDLRDRIGREGTVLYERR